MRRKIALKKLLAVTTGSLMIVGGVALASAAASDGPADSGDNGVVLSDPPLGSTIDDVVIADDQGANDDAVETDVADINDDAVADDQGQNDNVDETDVADTNDDTVGDDQGENNDDQGENEDADEADVNDDDQGDVSDDQGDDQGSED